MKLNIMLMVSCFMITACSSQSIRPDANASVNSGISVTKLPSKNADLIRVKAEKELKQVRMMEGGACNNNQQGIVALFSLYANLDDIDRIKLLQGPGIFTGFQSQIETFSMHALQQTVDSLNFKSDIQLPMADRFSALFADYIAEDIAEFEARTTLIIDVIPQSDSMTIYQSDCDTSHDH